MPNTPWSPAQAIAWLEGEHARPHENYRMECAHLAARARGYDASGLNASAWGHTIPPGIRRRGPGCPKGGMYWWITNGDTMNPTPYGHVATAYGRERVICNDANGAVSVVPVSAFSGLGSPIWLPPELLTTASPAFAHCSGANPYGPAPSPAPAPPGSLWPLRPGQSDPRVSALKRAFKWENEAPTYGKPFADRIVKWQNNHPAYGTADALVGPKTFHAITGG